MPTSVIMLNSLPAVFFGLLALGSRRSVAADTSVINCTSNDCEAPFPHCDEISGACQAVKRDSFDTWEVDFPVAFGLFMKVRCNEDGNYPSYDCRHFYQCVSGQATLKTCTSPAYPYFDPVLERCSNNPECPAIDCFSNFKNRAGLVGTLSSFFGYCSYTDFNSKIIPFVITRCYGNDVYDPNTGRCEPRCLHEGVIPDTMNCRQYILCSLVDPFNVRLNVTYHICPDGQAFQQKEHRCVPEEEVKLCAGRRAWPL